MDQLTLEGLDRGRQLRDQGIATVSANPANDDWRNRADVEMRRLVTRGEPFTAADLIDRTGMPPSPNAVGAVFHTAKRAGLIKGTGRWVKSRRPASHARDLREWVSTRG